MFENWNRQRKINAFRHGNVTLDSYDAESQSISLIARNGYRAKLGFDLVPFNGNLTLALSGDEIVLDCEALAQALKPLWNEKLPSKFSKNEQLRVQLGKPSPAPIEEAPAEEGAEEAPQDGFRQLVQPEPEPLYFRDMADYVMGKPTYVHITVEAYCTINK